MMGFAGFPNATTPLGATDILLVEQGGNTRGVTPDAIGATHVSARYTISSNLSVADSTVTTFEFDTTENEDGPISMDMTRTVVTVNEAGIYLITACLKWGSASGGRRITFIELFGTTRNARNEIPVSSAVSASTACSVVRALAAGSEISVLAFQDSGGSLNVEPDEESTHLAIAKVGPPL